MYAAVDRSTDRRLNTAAVCATLELARAAYYAWRSAAPSMHAARDAALEPLVRTIFWRHRRRYGARRIAIKLGDLGQPCSPRRVAKLLKNLGRRAPESAPFAESRINYASPA